MIVLMGFPITESQILAKARDVLLLLDQGEPERAMQNMKAVNDEDLAAFSPDVRALWIQVGIAASNPSDAAYLENVKDELNRITFQTGTDAN
jgi:hypothetical protein